MFVGGDNDEISGAIDNKNGDDKMRLFEKLKMCNAGVYDRTIKNADESKLYGIDDEDGTTTWYDIEGNLYSVTDTPDEDSQGMNAEGYIF